MNVDINGTKVRLTQANQLGAGGEGTVYKAKVEGSEMAVKVYHKPTTADEQRMAQIRQQKLEAFVQRSWKLPLGRVAAPIHLVRDTTKGQVIGLTMPFLGVGFEEVAGLANKKFRTTFGVTTQLVSHIFLDGAQTLNQIHQNGLVVGDLNDLNVLFRSREMLWIDVDAWQFDRFPCMVATEQFVAPELYGLDFSQKPVFKPEHDWYSFAVMLFKSLLLVHPFGGNHKQYRQLTARARQKITVFDPQVMYPTIALSPDLLSDDLAEVFQRYFTKSWRGSFPKNVLEDYLASLIECSSCHTYYPGNRGECPVCSAKTLIIIQRPTLVAKGVSVTQLVRTQGPIVFFRLVGNTVYALTYENGRTVLYTQKGLAPAVRKELFEEVSGARFELLDDDILVVNLRNETQLRLVYIGGSQPQVISTTETSRYAGNRRAMFRTCNGKLYRMVGGNLIETSQRGNLWLDRPMRQVSQDQTWFTMPPHTEDGQPTAFGFFQVLAQQMYWYLRGHQHFDVTLPALDSGEVLIDISAKFSSQGVAVQRLTQYQGVEYLRTDLIGNDGKVSFSAPRVKREDHPAPSIHGQTYSTGILLHATDEGVIQERIEGRVFKTFEATKGLVGEGDTLHRYQDGLLVVGDDQVQYLKLG